MSDNIGYGVGRYGETLYGRGRRPFFGQRVVVTGGHSIETPGSGTAALETAGTNAATVEATGTGSGDVDETVVGETGDY